MAKVLVIEDDASVREGLELALRRQGHEVRTGESGERGLEVLTQWRPDLVVLDLMLPGMDGFETCRRIRAVGELPIIMLTARSDDIDIVAGLEAGADDYVTKPVEPRVLDARIRAVLRRVAGERTGGGSAERHGDLVIDRAAMEVTKRGERVSLTPTELKLLLELSRTPGQVYSRQQILSAVWDHDYLGDSRLVDACVQRLRAKIEDVPARPDHVQTVRGFGYRFGRT
ncbi:response regulator transcription factor [Amycolatopsis samaneae]|uniref:Response regulator transcription factor n=1 Tax=Amycolatopsis samaneae TaxID=664691 RepID=A0ABW5G6I1_9PSEU